MRPCKIWLCYLSDTSASAFSITDSSPPHWPLKAHTLTRQASASGLLHCLFPLPGHCPPRQVHDSFPYLLQIFAVMLLSSEVCLDRSILSCNPLLTSLLFLPPPSSLLTSNIIYNLLMCCVDCRQNANFIR